MSRVLFLIAAAIALACGCGRQQAAPPHPPQGPVETRWHTHDIELFWQAIDSAEPDRDERSLASHLERNYLSKGSPGLRAFRATRIPNATALARSYRAHQRFYDTLRPVSLQLAADPNMQQRWNDARHRLNEIAGVQLDVDAYLLIGTMNSAGTAGRRSVLIGVEMFMAEPQVDRATLGPWHTANVRPLHDLHRVLIHEYAHTLQRAPSPLFGNRTLLEESIIEGGAEFAATLVFGEPSHLERWRFTINNEQKLWAEFQKDMHERSFGPWLFGQPEGRPGWPPDLGYAIGQRICQSFVDHAADRDAAVRAVIHMRDPNAIFSASRYNPADQATIEPHHP